MLKNLVNKLFGKLVLVTLMAGSLLNFATLAKASPVNGDIFYSGHRVEANSSRTYAIRFEEGDGLIRVDGDGDTDLDVYIFDKYGRLVATDEDAYDYCLTSFYVPYEQTYTIKVVNHGDIYNQYNLWAE